ncbi:MAG: Non-canonical purine NTP phosphatase [Methanonatronarchaeales archaeon]|nr:Non-canonical purine NTP phosphatase [Methanonatronarchaeales archaeon]
MRVAVGTENPVKVEAVDNVFSEAFEGPVHVVRVDVDSGVPEQPFDVETVRGARNRAEAAYSDGFDHSVGVEAGLLEFPLLETGYLDVQFCSVFDGETHSVGCGPGFQYPRVVLEKVLYGITVGGAMELLTGEEDVGERMGAIGILSGGEMDRTELTEQAVLMALVPRVQDVA